MHYLAIDIGASSGRHIVGWKVNGEIVTEEVYRFSNGVVQENDHLVWNTISLIEEVKKGIAVAKRKFPDIYSLSIDTWGVDYVIMEGELERYPVYAYRDKRTEAIIDEVHGKMAFSELYKRTGCQFQSFNSIYQLYADKVAGRLENATDILMMPEYLLYKLCGKRSREYTNATTSGLVNAATCEYDREILAALALPDRLFPKLDAPGKILGEYAGIKCVLCATHDTGSAVEGIPMDEDSPYISSGTWSLLGVKSSTPLTDQNSMLANYSNEGGVGYIRYQKNIMGMWLVNSLQKEICPELTYAQLVKLAEESVCDVTVDANDPAFLAPESMKAMFDKFSNNKLSTVGDYFRCAYRSLALCYSDSLAQLEKNIGKCYDKLYIVGGGANNAFLNTLTAQFTGKNVVALPIEATALGNLKVQMEV